jgi:dihydrofolate reductase
MRKLIYSMFVSLDGFIESKEHSLDWHLIDEELHQYVNDQMADVDMFLYGRRMYELMAEFWPTADADASHPGFIKQFARIWKEMPKLVFSRTLEKVDWNSTLVREVSAAEIVKLKAQPGKDLTVDGPNLAASFMKLDLIDEYQLFIHPIILGGGAPYFSPLQKRLPLDLVETHRFTSGVIFMRYVRSRPRQSPSGSV